MKDARHLKHRLHVSAILLATVLSPVPGASGTIHRVPLQQETIQAAVNIASDGDTILVSPGTCDENVDARGKQLVLRSEAGPSTTIVDGGYRDSVLRLGPGTSVEGFTLRNGRAAAQGGGVRVDGSGEGGGLRGNIIEDNVVGGFDQGNGGGVWIDVLITGFVVEGNVIRNNYAGDSGGGIYDYGVYNYIRDNVISGNGCHVCGGGIYTAGAFVTGNLVLNNWADSFGAGICGGGAEIRNNTVVGNYNDNNFAHGAGIHIFGGSPTISHNLVANNRGAPGWNAGIGIRCQTLTFPARLECNDAWGNDGGEYLISGYCDSTDGRNFSADPMFCGASSEDFRLMEESPCAPDSPCGLVGTFSVGCGGTPVEDVTWGRIKLLFQ